MDLLISPPRRPRRAARDRRSGMALIIVLASLVFLVALATAFLVSSITELKSSKTYAEGGRTQLLAQSAVNLALAQINEGTKGVDQAGKPLAWASQPGMIRTYDADGAPVNNHKLYSWDVITTPGTFDPTVAAEAIPTTWYTQTAVFTDLNQPIANSLGSVYPILDGNTLVNYGADKVYLFNGVPTIPGFTVSRTKTPVATGTKPNPAPMPVKWLYVLADGAMVAPSSAVGHTAKFSGAKLPTDDNPIVGRLAYWTDDETCKVNINTASEGTYTDSPRTASTVDEAMITYNQPVRGEYQRYPGHPAMTSISAVLSNLTDKEEIYGIIPRVRGGGSKGGTVKTTMNAAPATYTLTPAVDGDRLFASVDEFIFKAAMTGTQRTVNDPTITKTTLDQDRFFLTACSRAPDLNLFGKPRVNIWPISTQTTGRTPYDNTIAFCSTMRNDLSGANGPYRFYFQRQDPTDSTNDLPKDGSIDGLGRNRMIMEYLRSLTSQKIPGFGGKFSDKYGATDTLGVLPPTTSERDQILTEIFDYIRTTNLNDYSLPTASRYAIKLTSSASTNNNGFGQVVPIEDQANGTRGFGRYHTIQGGNFLFVGQVDGDDPTSQVDGSNAPLVDQTIPATISPAKVKVGAGQMRVATAFMPQLYCVSVGTCFDMPQLYLTVTGLEGFTLNGQNMGFSPSITPNSITNDWDRDGVHYGEQMGPRQLISGGDGNKWLGGTVDIPKTGNMLFSGGKVTCEFKTSAGKTVQTIVLDFPQTSFPRPNMANAALHQVSDTPGNPNTSPMYNMRFFHFPKTGTVEGGRLESQAASRDYVTSGFVFGSDVIRSVSSKSGDMRLIAARKSLIDSSKPAYQFAPNPYYTSLTVLAGQAHNMWWAEGRAIGQPFIGHSVKDAPYTTSTAAGFELYPDLPYNGTAAGKNAAWATGDVPGDWDTGVAEIRDGPYINKPDEGDMGSGTVNWPYKWKYFIGSAGLTPTLFTPNRQIPSPVTFGSLSTGVLGDKPWQTLLFRPGPVNHPGLGKPNAGIPPYQIPPDHLLLDLFHMPVVEPYAISEPFSTAGKINMNYQIMPFTYINRDSGIRAILKAEKVPAILTNTAANYKSHYMTTALPSILQDIDVTKTLAGFTKRFARNDIFRCPSEICDIDLVPIDYAGVSPTTRASMDTYWSTRLLTGDNVRERPYATIYPRLTTQSNTFTVHFRAEALKKLKGSDATVWDEDRDKVTGEFRGFQTVERYIDPNDPAIPDYANPSETTPINNFFKFRVIQAKQFTP